MKPQDYQPGHALGKAFLESLRLDYPEEFAGRKPSLKQQLKATDEYLRAEETHTDNPAYLPCPTEPDGDGWIEETYERDETLGLGGDR
jgi:hypothetical protein